MVGKNCFVIGSDLDDKCCLRFFTGFSEGSFWFGPYLCQPVIGGLSDGDKPFICTMDSIGAKLPWSNKYHPLLDEGLYPSPELRKLEIDANDVFSVYRDQYYEGGISSVYMWEDDNDVFVACFLIKKDGSKYAHGRMGYLNEGKWDAIHVIEAGPDEDGIARYCLTSTIISVTTNNQSVGKFSLSGSIRRQMSMNYEHSCL